jgi:hypothetical protein
MTGNFLSQSVAPMIFAVMIAGSIATSSAQINRSFSEELIAISVVLDVRSPSYTQSRIDEVTVFGSRPIAALVTLSNHTSEAIALREGLGDWTEALSVLLETVDDPATKVSSGATISRYRGAQNRNSIASVDPGGKVTERFIIQADTAGAFGRYRLTVIADEAKLSETAKSYRNILRRELIVNIREPKTLEELSDFYLQLAYETRTDLPAVSRQWSGKVLELNRKSIAALSDIGSSLMREGNCHQAAPILYEVVRLLSSGEDQALKLAQWNRQELASNIQERLTAQCGR